MKPAFCPGNSNDAVTILEMLSKASKLGDIHATCRVTGATRKFCVVTLCEIISSCGVLIMACWDTQKGLSVCTLAGQVSVTTKGHTPLCVTLVFTTGFLGM